MSSKDILDWVRFYGSASASAALALCTKGDAQAAQRLTEDAALAYDQIRAAIKPPPAFTGDPEPELRAAAQIAHHNPERLSRPDVGAALAQLLAHASIVIGGYSPEHMAAADAWLTLARAINAEPEPPTMPEGTHLAYTIYHETHWWQELAPHQRPNKGLRTVQIAASAKGQGEGVEWEFGVVEEASIGTLRISLHHDAWRAFAQMPAFFAELGSGRRSTLESVVLVLNSLGAVDETERAS